MGGGQLGHHAGTGLLAEVLWTAWFGIHVDAGLELADEDDLIPGPDWDGEGAGAAAQEGVGAIIGPLQGQDHVRVTTVDGQSGRQLEQYWYISKYIALNIQAGLLTVQVARCTPRGAVHHPNGTAASRGIARGDIHQQFANKVRELYRCTVKCTAG